MRSVQITEAKAKFSGLLAEVEAGETIRIMRRGRVIARLVPERPAWPPMRSVSSGTIAMRLISWRRKMLRLSPSRLGRCGIC